MNISSTHTNWIIGGTFDQDKGKPSSLVKTLHEALGSQWLLINGGSLDMLKEIANQAIYKGPDTLIWMPNISNDEAKLLPFFKQNKPNLSLIQSKRVVEKTYTLTDIQNRLAASQASHCIMITRDDDTSLYRFSLVAATKGLMLESDNIADIGIALVHALGLTRN